MISKLQKDIATQTAEAFSVTKPPILRMWDDLRQSEVFVLRAENRPQPGVNSYATVGLSAYPLLRDGLEFSTRTEILGACGSAFPDFDRVIASVAFGVINSKWFCAPGIIFPGVLDLFDASLTMSDVYFAYPFLWGDSAFKSRNVDGHTVAWLQAVPISKSETEYARRHGPKALEDLFEKREIDTHDLNRPSVA